MIKIRGFSKRYDSFVAVDGLDLDIEQGDVFGFIGPNGAGKTTTIRFLATLLKPTAGQGWINGYSVTQQIDQVKRSIGFMPDTFGVYDGMKVWEFLDFFATAYGLPRSKRRALIDDVLDLVDLTSKRDTLVNGLSRGMPTRSASSGIRSTIRPRTRPRIRTTWPRRNAARTALLIWRSAILRKAATPAGSASCPIRPLRRSTNGVSASACRRCWASRSR